MIGFQVKALYSDRKFTGHPINPRELYYPINTDQLVKMKNKNSRYGSVYLLLALPRYYENFFDEIAALIFNYVNPADLLEIIPSKKPMNIPKEYELRYIDIKYRYYTFGKLFRDLFRCKIGLEINKESFDEPLTTETIFRKIEELADPEDEKEHVSILLIINFTKMETIIAII